MDNKKVKDVMVPLHEYAVVSQDATILEAITALDDAQKRLPPGRHKHRAVLATNDKGEIVGKAGHLSFLRALEPKYNELGDVDALSKVGLSADFISSMMDHYRFFRDTLTDLCRPASNMKVRDIMRPVTESIEEDSSLCEAIHRMVMWQTLSILVTRGKEIVGLLRVSDIFQEVTESIKGLAESTSHDRQE